MEDEDETKTSPRVPASLRDVAEEASRNIAAILETSAEEEYLDTGEVLIMLARLKRDLSVALVARVPSQTVLVDIRGGNVQYTSAPDGIDLIIRDWDNCDVCGGEWCQGGHIKPCPETRNTPERRKAWGKSAARFSRMAEGR